MPLVTGSSGQLGSLVVDRLRSEGSDGGAYRGSVRSVDLVASRTTTHVGNVTDSQVLSSALAEGDAIVHCAAQVSVNRSVEDPRNDASHNIDGTLSVLEAARRKDASRVVYVSSAAVYGEPQDVPIAEDHPTDPTSPYGLSKLTGERYALLYRELYGLPVTAVRPFNIYSPRQDPSNPYSGVISKFLERIRNGEPPVIFGDGEQTRDFVHARDVVDAILLVLQEDAAVGRVFNVGTGRETSVNALAETMLHVAGREDLEPVHDDPRPGDIRRSVADISALEELGYEPQVGLEEGLRDMVENA